MKRNVFLFLTWMTFVISFAQTATEGHVNFFEGQVATIILPTTPDADKGKYFRIDRWEESKIIFEQELQPQAHVPYIIVPNEDFSIAPNTLDLAGLMADRAAIEGVEFIGIYVSTDIWFGQSSLYFLLDSTADCEYRKDLLQIHVGPLRAFFKVLWRFCKTWEKLEYVLHPIDDPDGMNALTSNCQTGTRKVIRDGHLYIIRNGEAYTLDGKKTGPL